MGMYFIILAALHYSTTHHLTTFTELLEVSLDVSDPQELLQQALDSVLSAWFFHLQSVYRKLHLLDGSSVTYTEIMCMYSCFMTLKLLFFSNFKIKIVYFLILR